MKPLIVKSPLTKTWYVLTRYREKKGIDAKTGEPNFYVVADVKHDVTDQMEAILKKERK